MIDQDKTQRPETDPHAEAQADRVQPPQDDAREAAGETRQPDASAEEDSPSDGTVEPKKQEVDDQAQAQTESQPESQQEQPEKPAESPEQLETYKNQILRLSADLENMRRRHQQEIAKAHSYGLEKCFRELIPVLDSLAMALSSTDEQQQSDNPMYEGVALTSQMLENALEKFGLARVDPAEKDAFDPELHEAMTTTPTADMPVNRVVQVIQCGYRLNDRLLRPARVIVSKKEQ